MQEDNLLIRMESKEHKEFMIAARSIFLRRNILHVRAPLQLRCHYFFYNMCIVVVSIAPQNTMAHWYMHGTSSSVAAQSRGRCHTSTPISIGYVIHQGNKLEADIYS
jgi:hypothetical protein